MVIIDMKEFDKTHQSQSFGAHSGPDPARTTLSATLSRHQSRSIPQGKSNFVTRLPQTNSRRKTCNSNRLANRQTNSIRIEPKPFKFSGKCSSNRSYIVYFRGAQIACRISSQLVRCDHRASHLIAGTHPDGAALVCYIGCSTGWDRN
jgi:hypothetical protein